MRNARERLSLRLSPLWERLDRNKLFTRLRSVGPSPATRLVNGRPVGPRRTVLRVVVVALGPRRVIAILHEAGAIYPCWGTDANDTPFFGWVETAPPSPDKEADGGG